MSAPEICDTCFPEYAGLTYAQVAKDNAPNAVVEDVMKPETFVTPSLAATPAVIIEFCDKCRWLHRATWVQTELLLTFPPPVIKSITLIPCNSPDTSGRFRIWLQYAAAEGDALSTVLIWDRKTRGGFPELKEVKQLIRDRIQPNLSLGHSDRKENEDAT